MTRPPARCNACQARRVAWARPRVDFCYDCLPGGPFTPPACSKCASPDRYFSEGLCDRCHPGAPLHLGSCRDCLAWGVYRAHSWRCWSCRWWHTHYPLGDCQYCGRHTRVGEAQACRLCVEQARSVQEPGRAIDLPGRDPQTTRIHIMGITPILTAWADAGHLSLAEITPEQVRAALPASGARRNWAEYGLRSLFKVLKSRKLIFTNPTRGMPITAVNATVPLPLDTDAIRRALDSPDAAVALAVALVAFHALTAGQLARLQVTDIVDSRLTLAGRDIPLTGPVRVRLAVWLDYRNRTWPASINPHLFVGRRSAPRLTPVGRQFPWTRTDLRPQALREDRILQEIHAIGGDVRRVCDLFGLNIETAMRYALTLGHPDLEQNPLTGLSTPVDELPSKTVD